MRKKAAAQIITSLAIITSSALANALNLSDFPQRVESGGFYQLIKDNRCADIPTDQGSLRILEQNVTVWHCEDKKWQKWTKVAENTYQNAQHLQCFFNDAGLDCSGKQPPEPIPQFKPTQLSYYPQRVESNGSYELKNENTCADIPTDQGSGRRLEENVTAWNCESKPWQKWIKVTENTYRNKYHPQCHFSDAGLDCSFSPPGNPTPVPTPTHTPSPSDTITVDDDCIYYENGLFHLNKPLALKNNGQACNADICNNPNRDYLAGCTRFVHADCFVINGQESTTGFHKGTAEGGVSNNHHWNNIDSIVLNGLTKGSNTATLYDKQDCSGYQGEFKILVE